MSSKVNANGHRRRRRNPLRTLRQVGGPVTPLGTVIVFDELIDYDGWEDHEHKAWTELLESWPTLKAEAIGHAHEAVAYRVTAA